MSFPVYQYIFAGVGPRRLNSIQAWAGELSLRPWHASQLIPMAVGKKRKT